MSYQEYAHLGRARPSTAKDGSKSRSKSRTRSRRGSEPERPYLPAETSFSAPRKSVLPSHITTPSTSTTASLSPSNSASQKGFTRMSKSKSWAAAPGPNATTLKKLKELGDNGGKKPELVEVPLPWRPIFLQRKVLVAFFAIFAAAIITMEALLDYSSKNAGLETTDRAAGYVWRLAPTALFTVIAAVWNRVEFQAKMAAPWLRLSKGGGDAEKTVLLDYHSMIKPVLIRQAIKNGDYVVACAAVISLLLRISIIISTGMVSLVFFMGSTQNAAITMLSEFVNDPSGLAGAGPLSVFTMLAIEQGNTSLPEGVSDRFAFQQFGSDFPSTTEFHAQVDGFSAALDCEVASMSLAGVENTPAGVRFNTAFRAGGCSVTLPVVSQSFSGSGTANRTHPFARFGRASCGNSTSVEDQRIVIVFGTGSIAGNANLNTPTASATVNGSIPQSQQLICKPTYSISTLDIIRNSTVVRAVGLAPTPNARTLDRVQPWDIAEAFFRSYGSPVAGLSDARSSAFPAAQNVNVDAPMNLAFGLLARNGAVGTPATYFDAETLQNVTESFFQQQAAVIARTSLMRPSSARGSCVGFLNAERLVVRTVAVQIIAVLASFMVLLDMVIICLVPGRGFLPRDPNTIMDTATLLAHSKTLLQSLRGAGGGDTATLRERLHRSTYYTGVEPYAGGSAATDQGYFTVFGGTELKTVYAEQTARWPFPSGLHPAQRVLSLFLTAGFIGALEGTLTVSNNGNGLAAVGDDTVLHFLWTSLPALIFGAFALLFVSASFSVRAIAPYAELTRGGTFETMTMNFVDRSTPMVLYKSLRTRNLAVFGSTLAAFLAILWPIFTSTMFTTISIPATAAVQLQLQDAFAGANPAGVRNGTLISSLILEGNLSYPAFTFEDLAFPTVTLPGAASDLRASSDLMVTATIPAARPTMSCLFFRQGELSINLTNNYRVGDIVNPLRVDIPGEQTRGGTELLASTFIIGTSAPTNGSAVAVDPNAFFGRGDVRPGRTTGGQPSNHWAYVWGQLSGAGTNQAAIRTISALTCDETMQQVDVATTFAGPSLRIDPANPPRPLEGTARASDAPLAAFDYAGLVNITTPHLLDGFFAALVSSRAAVAVTDLGVADARVAQQTVAQAVMRQHRSIRTQVLSASARGPGNPRAVPATLSSLRAGARRVAQDAATTRTLQALLAAAMLFSMVSWALLPAPNALPRAAPTTLAGAAALLADGNVLGFFGRGAEWQTTDEVRARFRDGLHVTAGFNLGWHKVRRRRRADDVGGGAWPPPASAGAGAEDRDEVFGISALRTGGWGGGEAVGLGLQARVGYSHRGFVRDLGWRT